MSKQTTSSASKKLDEKNVKLLRELAALPHNKQCFDCHQRGPTYINTTIGSFICTSCSGRLRGLNPPHRVKSISMATFSADEIEHLRSRGNEYCRKVWMGRHDKSKASIDETSFKDDTQMKDFLTLKYEKKRWYVSPSEIQHSPDISISSSSIGANQLVGQKTGDSAGSFGKSLSHNNGLSPDHFLGPMQNQIDASGSNLSPGGQSNSLSPKTSQIVQKDALVDLRNNDPFASPIRAAPATKQSSLISSHQEQQNFANFDTFQNGPPMPKSVTMPVMPQNSAAPVIRPMPAAAGSVVDAQISPAATTSNGLSGKAGDKYSALKELDELFNMTTTTASTAAPPASSGVLDAGVLSSSTNSASTSVNSNIPVGNPFYVMPPAFAPPTLQQAPLNAYSRGSGAIAPWGLTDSTPNSFLAQRAHNPFAAPQSQPNFNEYNSQMAPSKTVAAATLGQYASTTSAWQLQPPPLGVSTGYQPNPFVAPSSSNGGVSQNTWNPFMN